jgi:hypothetical protein
MIGGIVMRTYRKGWFNDSHRHYLAAKYGSAYASKKKMVKTEWVPELLKGGLADKVPDGAFNTRALQKGIKVEMEHTSDKRVAKEIAKDHLKENPKYYEYLEKMEKKMESGKRYNAKKFRLVHKGVDATELDAENPGVQPPWRKSVLKDWIEVNEDGRVTHLDPSDERDMAIFDTMTEKSGKSREELLRELKAQRQQEFMRKREQRAVLRDASVSTVSMYPLMRQD